MKKLFLLILITVATTFLLFKPAQSWAVVDAYQQIKEEYLQAVSVFQAARQDYLTAWENLKILRTLSQKKEVFEKAKDFLLKADQTVIKYLMITRKKIETTPGISESQRQASLSEIDSDISWLTAKQSEIQTAETKEQLTSLAKQVKDHWQKVRADVKRITGKILAAKSNAILTKLEEAYARVEKVVYKKKTAGKNTSQLENLLANAQRKLDLAKEKYEAGKNKFQAISNLEEANALFNQGTAFIKETNQYLRQAHQNLKEIVKQLK